MSSKYILYYSNTCEDCSRLLQLLSKTDEINLAIDFICIDERIKDAQNSYYVVVGDEEIVPIPKIITCVPSMIDVKNKI
jgi:glutaredoxin-related protein